MTWRRFALGLLALAALLAACNSGPQWIPAKTARTVLLDRDGERTEVTAAVAEELTLVLPPVSEPGHAWRLVAHDARVLKQTSVVSLAPGAEAATVSFITQRANVRTWLRFVLVREGAREAAPVAYHEVLIAVQDANAKAPAVT